MDITKAFKNERLLKAVTGMTTLEFETLLTNFEKLLQEIAHQRPRQCAIGAGRKGRIKSAALPPRMAVGMIHGALAQTGWLKAHRSY